METRKQALVSFLNCAPELITKVRDHQTFSYGSQRYLVLNDQEANAKAKEKILYSLWACNSYLLSKFLPLPERVIKHIQKLGVDANGLFLNYLKLDKELMSDFVRAEITENGRGDMISRINFTEYPQGKWFIYRIY